VGQAAQGAQQRLAGHLLEQEAGGAGAQARDSAVDVLHRGEHDDLHVGGGLADALDDRHRIQPGDALVQEHDVGAPLDRLQHRLHAVGGLAVDAQVRLVGQQRADRGADERIVIGDQDPQLRAAGGSLEGGEHDGRRYARGSRLDRCVRIAHRGEIPSHTA